MSKFLTVLSLLLFAAAPSFAEGLHRSEKESNQTDFRNPFRPEAYPHTDKFLDFCPKDTVYDPVKVARFIDETFFLFMIGQAEKSLEKAPESDDKARLKKLLETGKKLVELRRIEPVVTPTEASIFKAKKAAEGYSREVLNENGSLNLMFSTDFRNRFFNAPKYGMGVLVHELQHITEILKVDSFTEGANAESRALYMQGAFYRLTSAPTNDYSYKFLADASKNGIEADDWKTFLGLMEGEDPDIVAKLKTDLKLHDQGYESARRFLNSLAKQYLLKASQLWAELDKMGKLTPNSPEAVSLLKRQNELKTFLLFIRERSVDHSMYEVIEMIRIIDRKLDEFSKEQKIKYTPPVEVAEKDRLQTKDFYRWFNEPNKLAEIRKSFRKEFCDEEGNELKAIFATLNTQTKDNVLAPAIPGIEPSELQKQIAGASPDVLPLTTDPYKRSTTEHIAHLTKLYYEGNTYDADAYISRYLRQFNGGWGDEKHREVMDIAKKDAARLKANGEKPFGYPEYGSNVGAPSFGGVEPKKVPAYHERLAIRRNLEYALADKREPNAQTVRDAAAKQFGEAAAQEIYEQAAKKVAEKEKQEIKETTKDEIERQEINFQTSFGDTEEQKEKAYRGLKFLFSPAEETPDAIDDLYYFLNQVPNSERKTHLLNHNYDLGRRDRYFLDALTNKGPFDPLKHQGMIAGISRVIWSKHNDAVKNEGFLALRSRMKDELKLDDDQMRVLAEFDQVEGFKTRIDMTGLQTVKDPEAIAKALEKFNLHGASLIRSAIKAMGEQE